MAAGEELPPKLQIGDALERLRKLADALGANEYLFRPIMFGPTIAAPSAGYEVIQVTGSPSTFSEFLDAMTGPFEDEVTGRQFWLDGDGERIDGGDGGDGYEDDNEYDDDGEDA